MFRMLPGIAWFLLSLSLPIFHRADGSLFSAGWASAVGGIALALAAAGWSTRWQRSLLYLALALAGQASALMMINAPNYGVFQHYYPWSFLCGWPQRLLFVIPLMQTLLVALEFARLRRILSIFFTRILSPFQSAFLIFVLAAISVYGSWNLSRWIGELGLAVWLSSVNAINILLLAAHIPSTELWRVENWIRFNAGRTLDRRLPQLIAILVTVITVVIAWRVFEGIPHIPDSVGYLFQAKYFSVGRLYLPVPPEPNAFEFEKLYQDGHRWWNYGFPGWPVLLALGFLAGVPWLVNPLIAGFTILVVHHVVLRFYNRGAAHAVILLLAFSPWFLFLSASQMPHSFSLLCTMFIIAAVDKMQQSGQVQWGALAGICSGIQFLTRPLDAILVATGVGIWILFLSGRKFSQTALGAMIVFGALTASVSLLYNHALTGDYFYPPHEKWADERWYKGADRLGFGSDVGNLNWPHLDPFPGHGVRDIVMNTYQNLFSTNVELFGWSFGSLMFAALFLIWRRWTPADRLFLSIFAAVIAGHSVYWFSGGPDFGARYWYVIVVSLIIFTVGGILETIRRWVALGGSNAASLRIVAFAVTACLVSSVNFVSWRSMDKYHHYRGIRRDIERLADAYRFRNALVFVRETHKSDYPSALIFNPPTLQSTGTIYARDLGEASRAALARHFPGREIWIIAGSDVPGGRFRIIAGPSVVSVSPSE